MQAPICRVTRAPLSRFSDAGEGSTVLPMACGCEYIVSTADLESVLQRRWCHNKFNYVRASVYRNGASTTLYLHRMLCGEPQGLEIDHQDRNPLNNQRGNLRPCLPWQNGGNVGSKGGLSQYRGVIWDRERCCWRAKLVFRQRDIFLGRFPTEQEAARAYDLKAAEIYGEFAYLNIPEGARR